MTSKKCKEGCTCGRHKIAESTREALRSRKGSSHKKCKEGCTCGHHTRTDYRKCEPGCTCNRHEQTLEHREKNSVSNRGRKLSRESQEKRVKSRLANGPYQSPQSLEDMQEGRRKALKEGLIQPGGYVDGRSLHQHYQCWYNMMKRCTYPLDPHYDQYGGRGIDVYSEWYDPFKFYQYLEENLGGKPLGYSLDRIDNDKGYHPGNVRWASNSTQMSNRRNYNKQSLTQEQRLKLSQSMKASWKRRRQ